MRRFPTSSARWSRASTTWRYRHRHGWTSGLSGCFFSSSVSVFPVFTHFSVVTPGELQQSPGGPGVWVHLPPLCPGRDEGKHADAYQTGASQPHVRAAGKFFRFVASMFNSLWLRLNNQLSFSTNLHVVKLVREMCSVVGILSRSKREQDFLTFSLCSHSFLPHLDHQVNNAFFALKLLTLRNPRHLTFLVSDLKLKVFSTLWLRTSFCRQTLQMSSTLLCA